MVTMHVVVLADGWNHLGGHWSIAVLIFMGLGRNINCLPDVDERTWVHLKLYKADDSELLQREYGHPSPSHGSVVALEVDERESIG